MGFFHLFIFQLRPGPCGLEPTTLLMTRTFLCSGAQLLTPGSWIRLSDRIDFVFLGETDSAFLNKADFVSAAASLLLALFLELTLSVVWAFLGHRQCNPWYSLSATKFPTQAVHDPTASSSQASRTRPAYDTHQKLAMTSESRAFLRLTSRLPHHATVAPLVAFINMRGSHTCRTTTSDYGRCWLRIVQGFGSRTYMGLQVFGGSSCSADFQRWFEGGGVFGWAEFMNI